MKLTEVSVDGYGVCNNLRLTDLGDGLNVVYGRSNSVKSALAEYIKNVLYGFEAAGSTGHGALEAVAGGMPCRLSRTLESNRNLFVSDLQATSADDFCGEIVRTTLNHVGLETFDLVFCFRGNRDTRTIKALAELLHRRLHVPLGETAAGNGSADKEAERRNAVREDRLASLSSRIHSLQNECLALSESIDRKQVELRLSSAVDGELREVSNEIELLQLASLRTQIDRLDQAVSDLRLRLEHSEDRIEYVSRPFKPSTGLSALYQRLDEIDNQIRRWRSVHTDVQNQRVQLKDEMVQWNSMTIESTSHPYHRARTILSEIEAKVGRAESSISKLRPAPIVDSETAGVAADHLSDLCGQIRGDLYELCNELGGQYKSIRHRSGAAELKRLRRCYDEIRENIDFFIEKRCQLVDEIRQIDPAGADAIARNENEFCQCAQHHGYLQARREFVGEIAISDRVGQLAQHDSSLDQFKLRELENQRAAKVRELVAAENRLRDLQTRREWLLDQQSQVADQNNEIEELRETLGRAQLELRNCEDEKHRLLGEVEFDASLRPPDPILSYADQLVQKLTSGEIRTIFLTSHPTTHDNPYRISVKNRLGRQTSFSSLSTSVQQHVSLALSMAVVDALRRTGHELPVILEDVFDGLDLDSIHATIDTLADFCRRGNQVLAMTADSSVAGLARSGGATVLDLPETSVTHVGPTWVPDRFTLTPPPEPEFLTPFTTRKHTTFSADTIQYPQVKYPPAGPLIDHSVENFESIPVDSFRPKAANGSRKPVENSTDLHVLGVLDSNDLLRLSRLGITRTDQLLAVNPNQLPVDFVDAHVSSAQIDAWQSQIWLMRCIPELRPTDAQILVALGIREPEQFESSSIQQVVDRIHGFLGTADGQRFAGTGRNYDRGMIESWFKSLNGARSNWRLPSGYSRRQRWSQTPGSRRIFPDLERNQMERRRRRSRPALSNDRQNFSGDSRRSEITNSRTSIRSDSGNGTSPTVPAAETKIKFYLDLSNNLEAAPSIGPKTAERFSKINVNQVGEFLAQTAESMATKINYKRITADVIRQWQHQARLVCRVPNLRGHDAQLLVACGITEPEDLESRSPQQLFEIIAPFSETKEGLKIIRGGRKPDLDEITDWVNWARQTRSLQAA